jgi:hypothetical protein
MYFYLKCEWHVDIPSTHRVEFKSNQGFLVNTNMERGQLPLRLKFDVGSAFALQIIWFDCKSQNVLLDPSGSLAKLSDVGISKAMLNTHTQAVMVRSSFCFRDPCYLESGELVGTVDTVTDMQNMRSCFATAHLRCPCCVSSRLQLSRKRAVYHSVRVDLGRTDLLSPSEGWRPHVTIPVGLLQRGDATLQMVLWLSGICSAARRKARRGTLHPSWCHSCAATLLTRDMGL